MSLVKVEVRDEEFQEWLKRTKNAFVHMIETMKEVAQVVKENTIPLTPFEHGTLSRSFKWIVLTDNSRMKVLQVQMSALNPKTGYNYAWIQHENWRYHHPALESKYYEKFDSIKQANFMRDLDSTNNPTYQYLKKGIIQSQESAFELIEDDYLSLFTRGYIF